MVKPPGDRSSHGILTEDAIWPMELPPWARTAKGGGWPGGGTKPGGTSPWLGGAGAAATLSEFGVDTAAFSDSEMGDIHGETTWGSE